MSFSQPVFEPFSSKPECSTPNLHSLFCQACVFRGYVEPISGLNHLSRPVSFVIDYQLSGGNSATSTNPAGLKHPKASLPCPLQSLQSMDEKKKHLKGIVGIPRKCYSSVGFPRDSFGIPWFPYVPLFFLFVSPMVCSTR